MEIKKLLMVDDDESAMSDYRKVLRQAGIIVDFADSLEKGFKKINENLNAVEKYDFILLDLMLHGNIPPELEVFYCKIFKNINNRGQALGQWLWNMRINPTGAHKFAYCYLSAVPQNYAPSENSSDQEFGTMFSSFDEIKNQFVLSKLGIMPYLLCDVLREIKIKLN